MTPQSPKVALFDPARCLVDTPKLLAQLQTAFNEVLVSGQYILGPNVIRLEAEMQKFLRTPHALGVSSGTDALLLSLMAAGVGPGDSVLCPTFTFFATAGVISRLGAKPVFIDSCPGCYNILPQNLDEAYSRAQSPVRAIIPVHLFGQLACIDPILAWAKRREMVVIEDAAQAFGSSLDGRYAGTFGDFGCFSFFPTKNLGAPGDAGLVVTPGHQACEKLTALRVHGAKGTYLHESVGGNFRMDALQASLLSVKLQYLDGALRKRVKHARRYEDALLAHPTAAMGTCLCNDASSRQSKLISPPLTLPCHARGIHTYNQYVVRIGGKKRDQVKAHLLEQGITTAVYYPLPLHAQPCFSNLGAGAEAPVAQALATEVLALPIYPELRESEQARVIDALVSALSKLGA